MRRALLLAAALAGCGVKAAPRPPLKPGEPEPPPAAQQARCDSCPAPRSPPDAR